MRRMIGRWCATILMVCALTAGFSAPAAAQAGGLPAIRPVTSGRFDLTGMISVNGQTLPLAATGAFTGGAAQVDVTVTPPGAPAVQVSTIVSGGKLYIRQGASGQWQVADLGSMLPGNMAGLTGVDPAQLQALLPALGTVQQVGKATIGGAATTEYQADVDLARLASQMGSGHAPLDPATAALLQGLKATLHLWVGDADQYLHQMRIVLDFNQSTGGQAVALNEDLTITFRDFNAAITIAVPQNAVPLATGGLPGVGTLPGMVPGGQTSTGGPMPGMPRSGAGNGNVPVGLGLLGLLLAAGGLLLRRRAPARG